MKKTRLFKCGCGIKVVELVTDSTQEVRCLCGKLAKRQLSAPRYFNNTTGKSPSTK